jgi:hypothetical protein
VSSDGKVYVGGYFEFAGSTPARNVAMWDGQTWHPLGSGTDGEVNAIALRGQDVFVGGRFTIAGGLAAGRIARWNAATQTWHALASGINGPVFALALDADWVYAGGDFTSAGTVATEDMARWNGARWEGLGAGIQLTPSGTVYSILVEDDFVWIGGEFLAVKVGNSYPVVNSLLAWRPSSDAWYTVGGGVTSRSFDTDVYGRVYVMTYFGGLLCAGGRFDKAGPVAANGVACFDGANWSPLGSSLGGGYLQEVRAFEVDQGDLYVGGQYLVAGSAASRGVARWNALSQSWAGLDGGVGGVDYAHVQALARHDRSLYVGGFFQAAGAEPATSFALWNIGGTQQPQAAIGCEPDRVDFGEVIAGQTSEKTFSVTNTSGSVVLTGTVGVLAAPFSVPSGEGAYALSPGLSRTVTIRFAPQSSGDYSTTLSVTHNGGNAVSPAVISITGRGVEPTSDQSQARMPDRFALEQNYPNPFNPSTTIRFALPVPSHVAIDVLDALGRKLERIVNANYGAGVHEVTFQADRLPSGVYFYRIIAGEYLEMRRMLLLR